MGKINQDVGLGYTNTFKDKQGNEQRYIKLYLKQAVPEGSELVVFANTNKKSPKHPDFSVKLSEKRAEKAAPQANNTQRGNTGNGFPF